MRRLLIFLALASLAGGACKPENEPDWPYGPAPGRLPAEIGEDAGAQPPPGGGPDVVSSPDVGAPGGAPELAGATDVATDVAVDLSEEQGPVALDDALLLALRRPVTAAERDAAEAQARAGRALMAAMRPDAAIERLRGALGSMPTHVEANLLAARALTLTGDHRGALRHLLVLRAVGGEAAQAALQEARREPDLRPLHADGQFREVTGFGVVGIAVRRSAASRRELRGQQDALIMALEAAGLGAVRREPPKANLGTGSVVLHAPGAAVFAAEVAAALGGAVALEEVSLALGDDALLLWEPSEPLPSAASPRLDDLYDKRLSAQDAEGLHLIELRATGFFESEDRSAAGDLVLRRKGRFRLEGDSLVLVFKETKETLSAHSDLPVVSTGEGEIRVSVATGPGQRLVLDGRSFAPMGEGATGEGGSP